MKLFFCSLSLGMGVVLLINGYDLIYSILGMFFITLHCLIVLDK
jgi:hypothetical protein